MPRKARPKTPKPRKPKRTRFTHAEILAALQATGGNKTAAAASLEQAAGLRGQVRPCSRKLIDYYLNTSPKLRQAYEAVFEEVLDIAESVVITHMTNREKDPALAERAAEFMLRMRGKTRGWSERTEVTGADGSAIVVQISETDAQL